MSRRTGDDDGTGERDPHDAVTLPVKKKVTLAFDGPPLALPGDERSQDALPRAHQRVPDEDSVAAHDGWSRDRVSRGSGVHPAVTGAPSTPPQAGDGDDERPSSVEALDLVGRRHPSEPAFDLATEISERFALDDFTGALRAAELLLGRVPDHAEAARYADLCRARLDQIYQARLGTLTAAPKVIVPESEVRWLGLDHRAGFLLSLIDGRVTIVELVDVSGMGRLEVLKTLVDLLDAGTIAV
jgi:hypothetical protein